MNKKIKQKNLKFLFVFINNNCNNVYKDIYYYNRTYCGENKNEAYEKFLNENKGCILLNIIHLTEVE